MPRGPQKTPTKKDLICEVDRIIQDTPSLRDLLPSPFHPRKMRLARVADTLASLRAASQKDDSASRSSSSLSSLASFAAELPDGARAPSPESIHADPSPLPGHAMPSAHVLLPSPQQSNQDCRTNELQHDSTPPGSLPDTEHSSVESMALKLYIDDLRLQSTSTHRKRTLTVHVPALTMEPHSSMSPPLVCIRTRDILCAIQSSHSPIVGKENVQVGVADGHLSDYTEVFVSGLPSELLDIPHEPDSLQVSVQNIPVALCLRVDLAEPALQEEAGPSYTANNTTELPVQGHPSTLVEWLTTKASELDGYNDFVNGRNKLMKNHQIAASWEFASKFARKYHRKPHQFGQKRIRKQDIYNALGVKETWLNQAEEGYRIIEKFGHEGGNTRAQSVVDRLDNNESPPEGAVKLLQFLKDWDQNIEHHTDL